MQTAAAVVGSVVVVLLLIGLFSFLTLNSPGVL